MKAGGGNVHVRGASHMDSLQEQLNGVRQWAIVDLSDDNREWRTSKEQVEKCEQ